MNRDDQPFEGMRVTFYPGATQKLPPMQAEVVKVWGPTCVNLKAEDGTEFTSVFFVPRGAQKLDGYYCEVPDVLVQPRIVGYRQLNQAEADLMNAVKMQGLTLQRLIDRVSSHLAAQRVAAELEAGDGRGGEEDRIHAAEPARWLAMARTDLQVGLMKLVRAVAQPGAF